MAGKVVTGQPQSVTMVASLPTQEYQNGLFSCFNDCGNCIYAYCCFRCAIATARTNFDGSDWCFNCLCVDTPATLRNIIREGYHIKGDCCTDILFGCLCGPCTVCQQLNEVQSRGKVQLQWGSNRSPNPIPWNNGIFNCFSDCGNCLYGCFCPRCAIASARAQFDGSNCLFNFCCVSSPLLRNVIREGYNLHGNCCLDVLLSTFCMTCVAVQLLNEVGSRGNVNTSVVQVPR